jgi:hypothetical protein
LVLAALAAFEVDSGGDGDGEGAWWAVRYGVRDNGR